MAQRTVNERQLEVLRWIIEGCPGAMTDTTYKTTAIALQNRRLATVSRRRGRWSAEATDAGRYYAKHGAYPPTADANPVPAADAQPRRASRKQRPSENTPARESVESPVAVPPAPPPKVPVSARLSSRPHPVVAAIKKENLLPFKPDLRSRALRILDALAKEAERRGHRVNQPGPRHGYSRPDSLLEVNVRGHATTVALREPSTRSDHVLTPEELARKERSGYSWAPRYDYTPSGRLRLVLGGYGDQFTEPKSGKWTLESRLDRVLNEIEGRAVAAEVREKERLEEEARRRAHWETVRSEAVLSYQEHYKAEILSEQARRWHEHRALGAYVSAMEAHLAALPLEEADRAAPWLRWATERLRALAPFQSIEMPTIPEPTAEALKPFMKGLNPYGPDW